jgi:hypothetical protein
VGGGQGRYQLIGLDALDVLLDGDGGLRLVRERVTAVSGHGPGVLGLGFRGAVGGVCVGDWTGEAGRGNGGGRETQKSFSLGPGGQVSVKLKNQLFVPTSSFPPRRYDDWNLLELFG